MEILSSWFEHYRDAAMITTPICISHLFPSETSLQNVTNQIRRIEPEKTSKIQDCEAFIESLPESSGTTLVKSKVEETNNKYNWVAQLLNAAEEK